jgi:hypothetical protein
MVSRPGKTRQSNVGFVDMKERSNAHRTYLISSRYRNGNYDQPVSFLLLERDAGGWILKRLVVPLIIISILCAGCIGTPPVPEPIPTVVITPEPPTPEPTPAITTTMPTPTPLPTIPPAETIAEPETPDPEPVPTPMLPTANITVGMNFTNYTYSNDFKLQYPADWIPVNNTFRAWTDRVNSIPEQYQQEGRQTFFGSENNRTWFNVRVYDWIAPGGHKLDQNLQTVKTGITEMCPDVSGDSAVSNYRLALDDFHYLTMNYDVKIPLSSNCSPLEYSERTFVSYNHLYKFDFATTEGTLDQYRDLRDAIMKSVVPEPQDVVTSSQKVV